MNEIIEGQLKDVVVEVLQKENVFYHDDELPILINIFYLGMVFAGHQLNVKPNVLAEILCTLKERKR